MKRRFPILILLVLPVLMVILSLIYKNSRGEYFIFNQYDPAYAYLLNSLNLAQLKDIGQVEHPGTPVQVMGAVVLKSLNAIRDQDENMVKDVFLNSELYLSNINLIFILMIGISLFILGIVVYKTLKNIYAALILQTTPFYFSLTYYEVTNVNPETFLIFTVLIFIAIAISFTNKADPAAGTIFKYVILFGIVCGFGMACKLIFFPLLIIPLILIKKFSFKALFTLVSILAFLIFVSPAITSTNISNFYFFVKKLVVHSGKYGAGSESFVEPSSMLKNLKIIFTTDPVFSLSYILIASVFLMQFSKKYKKRIVENKYYRLFLGIFIAMSLQIFLVAKHYDIHYILSALMLSVLGLFVINDILSYIFPEYFMKGRLVYLSLILICCFYLQLPMIIRENENYTSRRNETYKGMNFIEQNYNHPVMVSIYGASNKECALNSSASPHLTGSQGLIYRSVLGELFPNSIYYNRWTKNFQEDVKPKLVNANKFIFRSDNTIEMNEILLRIKELTNKQNATYKQIYQVPWGESIYEITLEPS